MSTELLTWTNVLIIAAIAFGITIVTFLILVWGDRQSSK
jgi:hypothetical protein